MSVTEAKMEYRVTLPDKNLLFCLNEVAMVTAWFLFETVGASKSNSVPRVANNSHFLSSVLAPGQKIISINGGVGL